MKTYNIVFMGTPEFAVTPLQRLLEEGYKPVLCITQPDRPKGRKKRLTAPPVKDCALKHGIKCVQPEDVNSQDVVELLQGLNVDLIVTAAYGEYIGRKIRKLPKFAAINIHPSLLPKYRGATPVNSALWHGDKITGVTIFRLVAAMDAGPVLSQSEYEIIEKDNYTRLLEKQSLQGAEDLIKLLKHLESGKLKEIPQDDNKASFCHKLKKEDFSIDWSNSAESIYNQIRALAVKPGAKTQFRDKVLKIISSEIVSDDSSANAGEIIDITKNGILVCTGKDRLLIKEVHPAGKKIMTAYAYNLGARIQIGEKFI